MKTMTIKLGLLLAVLLFAAGYGASKTASDKPVFDGKDTLLNPGDYRDWVFVGSNLGLGYASNPRPPQADQAGRREVFHNLYINPFAYREYSRTGQFPEGTMMILEFATKVEKNEAGLQGLYQGEILGMEASVKDSKRFSGGWGYYNFTDDVGKPLAKAQPFPESSCWSCHHQKAATDHVFTQFYPVLRKTAAK
jgi:hypothetical protein